MSQILILQKKITQAAIESLLKHETDHYTPTLGLDELKQAISDFHLRKDGVKVSKQQVAVFCWSKVCIIFGISNIN